MLLLFVIGGVFSYIVSKYDQELQRGEAEIAGFLKDHEKKVKVKNFGDLSIISFNMEKKESYNYQEQTDELIRLIDNVHPTIISLQECDIDQIKSLEERTLPHYGIVEARESKVINPTNGNVTFIPILYDTRELEYLKSGQFKSNDQSLKNTYATWAHFKLPKKNIEFVVVNINLYSPISQVDSLELASILYDAKKAPFVKDNLVLFAGTINGLSDNTKTLLNKGMIKLSNYKRNEGDLKNTLKTFQDAVNNTERDFVLGLNTKNVKVQPVYSAVLRLFTPGARFPIHSIVTISHN